MADTGPDPNLKPLVPLDAFASLDVRLGTIEKIESVPKSDRLMRLRVDFGTFHRTVIAGIRQERPNPDELVVSRRSSW